MLWNLLAWMTGAVVVVLVGGVLFLVWAFDQPIDRRPKLQPPSNDLGINMPTPPGMFVLQNHRMNVPSWDAGWSDHGRFAVQGEPGQVLRALGKQFEAQGYWFSSGDEDQTVPASDLPTQLLFRRKGRVAQARRSTSEPDSLTLVAFKYKKLTVVDVFRLEPGPPGPALIFGQLPVRPGMFPG